MSSLRSTLTPREAAVRLKLSPDCAPACRSPQVVQAELQVLLGPLAEYAWVAGGFAVDPRQATDVDVFLVGVPHDPAGMNSPVDAQLDSFHLECVTWKYPVKQIVRGWHGLLPSGLPVHVFWTFNASIQETLAGFDIADQAMAWAVTGTPDRGPVHADRKVLTVREKPVTWHAIARILKIAVRYYKPPSPYMCRVISRFLLSYANRPRPKRQKDWYDV